MEERNNQLPYENEEAILPEETPVEESPAEAVPEAVEAPAAEADPKPEARDFAKEVRALYEARPELRGKDLPEEVAQACVGGKSLVEAYNDFACRQREDAAALRKENRILRQNAATAARAPVRGVTRGGSTDAQPEDAFLRGFNEAW